MRTVELLRQVRDGEPVVSGEIRHFVERVTNGDIPDHQIAAFLMAVRLRGLSDELTTELTCAMRDSGRVVDLGGIPGIKVDKHSTGGVGDKISLALAPLVAACGVPVPMVSGRGLGHTGGTLDKLEAIPGFRVDLPIDRFRAQVETLGVCMIGQTADLAPADRKLYALRDVTATVESISLITASILAKKLASGIDALVLDVKVGRGAFMKDRESARALARSLVRVGTGAGLRVRALLTRMEEPLGTTIGNALEVREALAILRGQGPQDTTELTLLLGAEMLQLGGVAESDADARRQLWQALDSGAASGKMRALIAAQDGDARVVDEPDRLPRASHVTEVEAARSGYVEAIDSEALGRIAMELGAGREQPGEPIDHAVGFELSKGRGDRVEPGEPLLRVHWNRSPEGSLPAIRAAFHIGPEPPTASPLLLEGVG